MGMSPLGDLDPSAGACRRGRLWKTRDVDAWLRQTMDAIGSDAELTDADADALLKLAKIAAHTSGFEEFRAAMSQIDPGVVLRASGLTEAQVDELAARYMKAERVIVTWAMGITQHTQAVDTIKEIVNLLLLRGNVGKPGAGASPKRPRC